MSVSDDRSTNDHMEVYAGTANGCSSDNHACSGKQDPTACSQFFRFMRHNLDLRTTLCL